MGATGVGASRAGLAACPSERGRTDGRDETEPLDDPSGRERSHVGAPFDAEGSRGSTVEAPHAEAGRAGGARVGGGGGAERRGGGVAVVRAGRLERAGG